MATVAPRAGGRGRIKSLDAILATAEKKSLKRSLGAFQLTLLGEYVDEIANRPQGVVPHYLVGKNPAVKEFLDRYKLPLDAAMGGAKTMYPEYQLELEKAKAK